MLLTGETEIEHYENTFRSTDRRDRIVQSVFTQFELPSHASWFYVALCAAVALFYQFPRPLAIRNFDLFGLFLFVPGLLLLDESRRQAAFASARAVSRLQTAGYSVLVGACIIWFLRCFYDLSVLKRARIAANLTPAGLMWLSGALLIGLGVGAISRSEAREASAKSPTANVENDMTTVVLQPEPAAQSRGAQTVAILCQVVVVILLLLICRWHFQDTPAGTGTGLFYLLLPSTAYTFDEPEHVWPAMLILAAILSYRRAQWAGVWLGLAAGTAYFPLILFPAWLQFYRGRGTLHFMRTFSLAGILGLGLQALLAVLIGETATEIWPRPNIADWQPWRVPSSQSLWTGTQWAYRLPVFVAFVGLAIGAIVWPVARNLGQLIALSAMLMLSLQFWLADGGGRYVTWFSPLLLLIAFRPTTLELQPPVLADARSWISACYHWIKRRRFPRRLAPVSGNLS